MSLLHPKVEFENISQSEVNIKTVGANEFRTLAEQSKALFEIRKQTIKSYDISQDEASVEISVRGILANDLPNGMKSSSTIKFDGRSQFSFKDGKIFRIVDI